MIEDAPNSFGVQRHKSNNLTSSAILELRELAKLSGAIGIYKQTNFIKPSNFPISQGHLTHTSPYASPSSSTVPTVLGQGFFEYTHRLTNHLLITFAPKSLICLIYVTDGFAMNSYCTLWAIVCADGLRKKRGNVT
jgi:hypothetical protein